MATTPTAQLPTIGLILPALGQGAAEAEAMYPGKIRFISRVVGLQSMSRDGYEEVVDRIAPSARELAQDGADLILLMGTSLSFYKGRAFNDRLRDGIEAASGRPALTMSDAMVDGLKWTGAHKIAAATAYGEEVNALLSSYFRDEGFDVLAVRGLGITSLGGGALDAVTPVDLVSLSTRVIREAPDARALLLSCGGLRTFSALPLVENSVGRPVISSFPHTISAGVRRLGIDARISGHGRLLAAA